MQIKISVDFDGSGEDHPLLEGFDIELEFKLGYDKREAVELIVDRIRKAFCNGSY